MIAGKKFTNSEIAEKEAKFLEDYYHNNDPRLSDSVEYYSILFQSFLRNEDNQDDSFKKLENKQKEDIFKSEDDLFRNAMHYAFNKGHQTAFLILLMNSRNSQTFDESIFAEKSAKDVFLFNLDNLISEDVYNENLRRSQVELLINYTRDNFENGLFKIMDLAKIFFKKGCEIAYEQITEQIIQVQKKDLAVSRITSVDLNDSFQITPAFSATFVMESPRFEEWDIHWDSTYGHDVSNKLIGTFLIHQLTIKEIKNYAEVGAIVYQQMLENLSSFEDDEIVYLGEIRFSLIEPPLDGLRTIEKNEISAIQYALTLTLKRKLGVPAKNILIIT